MWYLVATFFYLRRLPIHGLTIDSIVLSMDLGFSIPFHLYNCKHSKQSDCALPTRRACTGELLYFMVSS